MTVTELSNFDKKCTGCSACANVCPVNAIQMNENKEGFFYPFVDSSRCISCERCLGVCVVNTENLPKDNFIKCYSYQGPDEVRKISSSGGAFYALAQAVLEQNGVVHGAAYNSKLIGVNHCSTEDVPLENLLRSKYVQSQIDMDYRKVRTELDTGRCVLFAGTPCQVYGLKKYLKKDYENLITMDFVCHGVPSPGFFRSMVLEYGKSECATVTDVTFREKDFGWRTQVIKFYFSNGNIKTFRSKNYFYYYYFLRNMTIRKSCFFCHMPENHCSDITVMDYWHTKSDDGKGLSACVTNTEKGDAVLRDACAGALNEIQVESLANCFIPHDTIGAYRRYYHMRNRFMSHYTHCGIKLLLHRYDFLYRTTISFLGFLASIAGNTKKHIKKLRSK